MDYFKYLLATFFAVLLLGLSTRAMLCRGLAYAATSQDDLALKDYDNTIKIIPDKADLLALRGLTYSNMGQLDNATQDFAKAQTVDPNSTVLLEGRGMLEVLKGSYENAIKDLELTLQNNPGEPYVVIWLHLAKWHAQQDDRQEFAQNVARMSEKSWPSSVIDLYDGRTIVDAVLKQAASGYDPMPELQTCEAYFYIGDYYLQQQDRVKAKSYLQKALQACPKTMSNEKQAAHLDFKSQGF